MWSTLLPGLATLDDAHRKSVIEATRGKWARVVMICSGLLLVSGLYNAVTNIMQYDYDLPYHAFVTLKLILGIAVMFITAKLSGRTESAAKFREQMSFWMTVNTTLVIVLALTASTMKVTGKTPKAVDSEVSVELNVEQE